MKQLSCKKIIFFKEMVKSFFIYSNNKNKDKAIYNYSKNYMFLTSSSTLAS